MKMRKRKVLLRGEIQARKTGITRSKLVIQQTLHAQ